MKVSCRIYEQKDDVLLAACDKDLLGSTLKEGEIHLTVKENFYGGEILDIDSDKKKLHAKFKKATIGNLVGSNVVEAAIEAKFGNENDIMRIDGIPHLQIVRM